jgi:excisionase family DNA binding protein
VAEQEFYSFDEALKQLRLKEEELKRLVSEGEIRAFREGGTMKLRRTDVESLRTELSGGEMVDMGEVKEELVFEDDVQEEAGMATQEISDVETILDEPVVEVSEVAPEISIEEVPAEGEVELEAEGEVESEEAEASPARASRSAPRAAPEVEVPAEPMLVRIAVLLTVLLLLLALPLCLSASSGVPSGVAGAISGLFAKSAAP